MAFSQHRSCIRLCNTWSKQKFPSQEGKPRQSQNLLKGKNCRVASCHISKTTRSRRNLLQEGNISLRPFSCAASFWRTEGFLLSGGVSRHFGQSVSPNYKFKTKAKCCWITAAIKACGCSCLLWLGLTATQIVNESSLSLLRHKLAANR